MSLFHFRFVVEEFIDYNDIPGITLVTKTRTRVVLKAFKGGCPPSLLAEADITSAKKNIKSASINTGFS